MNVQEQAARFSEALVSEIKAEMGRQSLSSRALGRLIGKSSQYMSDRLDGGSPKTGRRTLLNTLDLAAIAEALNMPLLTLITRAENVASDQPSNEVVNLHERRKPTAEVDTVPADHELPAAAFHSSKIRNRDKYRDDSGFEGA